MKKTPGHRLKHEAVYWVLAVIATALIASTAFAGTVIYDYDNTGQLESVTLTNTTTWFGYDPAGNVRHISSTFIDIDVDPQIAELGTMYLYNTTSTTYVAFRNYTTTGVFVNSVTLASGHTGDFSIVGGEDGCTDQTVNNDYCTVGVSFTPQASGDRSAVLRFATNHATISQLDLTLTGAGTNTPSFSIWQDGHNYGDTYTGYPNSATFLVRNERYAQMDVSYIGFANTTGGLSHFSVANDQCTTGTVAHLDECSFDVAFDPQSFGEISGYLIVNTSGPSDQFAGFLNGVGYDPVIITNSTLPSEFVNTPYSTTLSVTNGLAPYSWSVFSGSLPTGLALNSTSGEISGTPTVAGAVNLTIQAKDARRMTTTKSFLLIVDDYVTMTIYGSTGGEVWKDGELLLDGNGTAYVNTTLSATETFVVYTDEHYHFDYWNVLRWDPFSNWSVYTNTLTFDPVEYPDYEVWAEVAIDTYTITEIVIGDGDLYCTNDPPYGSDAHCYPENFWDERYKLTALELDDVQIAPTDHLIIANVTSDHTVKGTFTIPVSLPLGTLGSGQYGHGYGTDQHYERFRAEFTDDGYDRLLHVAGYDIDYEEELAVYLNEGTVDELFLGYVTGIDNSLGADNMFWLVNSSLVSGANEISFVQSSPGDTWGITRLGLFNTGSAFGNITGGDTEHVEGFELHFQGGESKLLEMALWDSDSDAEVVSRLNDLYNAGLPGGIVSNDVYSTWYQYYMADDDLYSGDNLLVINAPDAGDDWGVKLNSLDPGDVALGYFGIANESSTDDDGVAYLLPIAQNSYRLFDLDLYHIGPEGEVEIFVNGTQVLNAPSAGEWDAGYRVLLEGNQLAVIDITNATSTSGTDGLWGVSAVGLSEEYPLSSYVDAGSVHSIALTTYGTVWTWGDNQYGQLGDGTRVDSAEPQPVIDGAGNLSEIKAISSTHLHNLALKSDGSVKSWGYNLQGQVGNNDTNMFELTPETVVDTGGTGFLNGVVDVEAGYYFSAALKVDGTVWTWGDNNFGQLGDDNKPNDSLFPVQVSVINSIVDIETGYHHTLALRADGTVWAWGYNYYGQLGDETNINKNSPVQVSELSGIVDIAAGSYHSLALMLDGTVWAWGYNADGQLGDGTNIKKNSPVQVEYEGGYLSGIVEVYSGRYVSMAKESDGTLWAWGFNETGQLGDGTLDTSYEPVIINTTSIDDVAIGAHYVIAVDNAGDVLAWGNNGYGQLGLGNISAMDEPYQVSGISDASGITAGYYHSAIINSDGSVWSWGYDVYHQSGDGIYGQFLSYPSQALINDVDVLDAGRLHVTAVSNGTAWAWGYGASGQIGQGDTATKTIPVDIDLGSNVVNSISGGNDQTLAVVNGTVWAWGNNAYGQLGLGNATSPQKSPKHVSGLSNIVSAVSGWYHSIALSNTGNVWAWGYNLQGQVGIGNTEIPQNSPVPLSGLSDIVAVSAGGFHSLALTNTGDVLAWGHNGSGQLGLGNKTSQHYSPEIISELDDIYIVSIHAGKYFSAAITNAGDVYTWGDNPYGQLGVGDMDDRTIPTLVNGISCVYDLDAGEYHIIALKDNGEIWTWGTNGYGQLGYVTDPLTPTDTLFDIYYTGPSAPEQMQYDFYGFGLSTPQEVPYDEYDTGIIEPDLLLDAFVPQ